MKKLLSFLVLAPLIGLGQGVHFESGLSWQQILAKAKAENKYIFVDCYASWCGPCKKMDQDVYPKDSVGSVVNPRFVCVKVQLDTSKIDDEAVKAWYADAHALMAAYKISAFPTFLFFSPAGELVHRGLGYQQPKDFAQLAMEAVDPHKQYYGLVTGYRSGDRDYAVMPSLANHAKAYNDKALADSIAADYLHGYLDKLSNTGICTKPNLDFIAGFAKVLTSKDQVFKCIWEHPELADTAMHDKDFAKRVMNYMITKEEITPLTTLAKKEGKEPDWEMIGRNIQHKYGVAWVEENVVNAKIGWYRAEKDWKNYTKCLVRRMDLIGLQNIPNDFWGRFSLNNSAWDIFLYSDNKEDLEKAMAWSEWVIQRDPTGAHMDTKANLLYKLGKKEEALALEAKAVQATPKSQSANFKSISANFEKMEHDEPTWAVAH
jgi:thioredoxin-related protein